MMQTDELNLINEVFTQHIHNVKMKVHLLSQQN